MTSYVCALCGQRYPEPGYCGADGGTLVVPADPLLGEQVGRWRLARVVGAGGMGRVYLGVQPDIGSRVAVKVLSEECARDPALIERFFAEARAVNLIRHEHIVNVLDLARLADGRPYIVMEFVEGGTLGELSRRGELSAGMVVHVTLQVLEALAAAHRQGVVHRDLKPDNVLVTRGGQAKVLDFGIAKLAPSVVGTNSPRTQTGALLGTPEYMAPEQVSGGVIDGRTDLYACGVMLYELVTGQRPFVSGNLFALMRAHVEDQPVPPRALRADVPVGLEEVILRALAKDPAARFVDADDMANALVAAGAELAPGWPSARTSGQRAPVSGSGLGGGNTGRGPGTPRHRADRAGAAATLVATDAAGRAAIGGRAGDRARRGAVERALADRRRHPRRRGRGRDRARRRQWGPGRAGARRRAGGGRGRIGRAGAGRTRADHANADDADDADDAGADHADADHADHAEAGADRGRSIRAGRAPGGAGRPA